LRIHSAYNSEQNPGGTYKFATTNIIILLWTALVTTSLEGPNEYVDINKVVYQT